MKKVFIDCDPGADDALALLWAHHLKEVEIIGLSTVVGNMDIETVTRNAGLLMSYLQLSIPLFQGASQPLIKKHHPSTVHGTDGLGGARSLFQKPPQLPDPINGLLGMRNFLLKEEKPRPLLALGPLTNIALLIKTFPEVSSRISRVYVMGGALKEGNVTIHSEFNFYVDPEAAQILLQSQIPLTLIGLDVTNQGVLSPQTEARLHRCNHPGAKIFLAILKGYGKKDPALHDPCALLALTHPHLFTYENLSLTVDTSDSSTRGKCRVVKEGKPNCQFALSMDLYAFEKLLLESFEN